MNFLEERILKDGQVREVAREEFERALKEQTSDE